MGKWGVHKYLVKLFFRSHFLMSCVVSMDLIGHSCISRHKRTWSFLKTMSGKKIYLKMEVKIKQLKIGVRQ